MKIKRTLPGFQTMKGCKEKGSGLGLIITKELVSIQNGSLQIDSTVGEGTTITISLPKRKPNKLKTELLHYKPDIKKNRSLQYLILVLINFRLIPFLFHFLLNYINRQTIRSKTI